ncbi:MAG: 4Fe-4S dicluster domain-containing protein [Candidatus Korarchaeota archaeon]|nr:4Fe-4S dicluster domain-containing protein [Candidatus Korarchaeota archaeon]
MGEMAIAFNVDNCIFCRACQVACHVWNNTRPQVTEFSPTLTNPPDLLPNVWMVMEAKEVVEGDEFHWLFLKRQCMHCSEAPCAKACPVNAIEIHPEGAVVIREDKCTGCRFCIEACPYDVPKYDESSEKVYKCTFCIDRIQNGLEPACVAACPTDALVFGDYDELVNRYRSQGFEVYGDSVNDYVGRTHYIYVTRKFKGKLTDPKYFGERLKKDPRKASVQVGTNVVEPVGWGLIGLTLLAAAGHFIYWRTKRIEEKSESEGEKGGE